MKSSQLEAYRLMHEGALAFAEIEHNGVRIDVEHLKRAKIEAANEQRQLKQQMQEDEVYKLLVKRFGSKANPTSPLQLAKILTADLGQVLPQTENKRPKTDEETLAKIDLPFFRMLGEYKRLAKLETTYIDGVLREVVGEYLHTVLNLHLVTSFRSSDDSPNLQNVPTRIEKIAKIIRSGFIPRDGHVLVERDYSALEFKGNACQWLDPSMIEYASDPTKDIHRDCAARVFKVGKSDVNKKLRYCAKNMFVFPEIYGDWYLSCAEALWDAVQKHSLKVGDVETGVPMFEHLRGLGINRLGACDSKKQPDPGTFESHLKACEKEFYQWFPVLKENRDKFWAEYQKRGYFELMTGFVIHGVWKRNFVLNVVVQGPAFHLLLWSLIQLVKWARNKKSKIVLQIHDCILSDIHRSELDEYLEVSKDIMTVQVRKRFPWVVTPLEVETEICEDNWYDKKKVEV